MTAGQRWRRRRDLTLFAARAGGLPVPILADVFDLSSRHVRRICARQTEQPRKPQPPVRPSGRPLCRRGNVRPAAQTG